MATSMVAPRSSQYVRRAAYDPAQDGYGLPDNSGRVAQSVQSGAAMPTNTDKKISDQRQQKYAYSYDGNENVKYSADDSGFDEGFGAKYNKPPSNPSSAPGYNRYVGNNLKSMISNDRDLALGRGDELYQQSKDRAANEGQVRSNYRAYGDEVYDPMIGGRGGYSPEERDAIMREGDFDNFMTNDGGYGENYLSDDERSQIAGKPWNRAAYFDPDSMTARQNESADKQRGAVDDMGRGMYESLDGQLGLSDDYSRGVDSTLSSAESRVRGAYDPNALRANSDSLNRIRMTPREEQDIVTKAGISGGMKYRAAIGDMDQKARAAGLDPVAAAAMRGRYLRNAAADSADAMTGARVQASNARAGRETTAENLRMGGERTAADIGTGTEMALGTQRLNANTTREGMRLDSQRDIASRRAGIAQTLGQTRLGAEQGINAQQRQQAQYNATTGTDMATGIERDEAARAQYLANNRQQTSRANQQQRFQQGAGRNEALSGRAMQVAGARRADAQEGRGWIRDQAGVANQNAQNEYNRQGQTYATQGQLAQGTSALQQKQNAQPKWWEKLIGAGAQAAGAAAGFV